jgi:hypothetical protein
MNPMITALLFLSLSAAAPAAAQSFLFNVDFDFSVAGKKLPPGVYHLEPRSSDGIGLFVRNEASGQAFFLNLPTQERSGPSVGDRRQVAFRCVHQDCELSAVRNLRPGLVYRRWESNPSKKDVYFRMVALVNAAK